MENCIFCKISRGEVPTDKIAESDNFIVINDANPVSEGHCLIIPKRHYATIFDLQKELGSELIGVAQEQGKRLMDEGLAEGVKLINNNFEASGQIVNHFHLHLIPEKKGVTREKHI